jgi:hypothetical protein
MNSGHLQIVLDSLDFSPQLAIRVLGLSTVRTGAAGRCRARLDDVCHRPNHRASCGNHLKSDANGGAIESNSKVKRRLGHEADAAPNSCQTKRRGRPKGTGDSSSTLNGHSKETELVNPDGANLRCEGPSTAEEQQAVTVKKSRQHGVEGIAMMPSYLRSRFGDRLLSLVRFSASGRTSDTLSSAGARRSWTRRRSSTASPGAPSRAATRPSAPSRAAPGTARSGRAGPSWRSAWPRWSDRQGRARLY